LTKIIALASIFSADHISDVVKGTLTSDPSRYKAIIGS
jgi:hypothetical protein